MPEGLITMADVVKENLVDGAKKVAGEAVKKKTGKQVAGNLLKKALISDDKKGPHIRNAFTGKKPNGLMIGGLAIAGAATAIGAMGGLGEMPFTPNRPEDASNVLFGSQGIMATKHTDIEQVVNPSVAAAGRAPSTGNAPNLSASGDMVFGMHKGR